MLDFSVISSGSKANSLFVTDGVTKILVDCGLSARETARRLSLIGVEPTSIDAIVVTHEHRDHVKGIPVFAKRYHVPVFTNHKTAVAWCDYLGTPEFEIRSFVTGEPFDLGGLRCDPFSVSHDAADPVMLRISSGPKSLAIATDLGHSSSLVKEMVREVDALILESNHDEILLQECEYPWELKQRIRSRTGHLSNTQAATLLEEICIEAPGQLKHLIGGHISENSNLPELVVESFRGVWRSRQDLSPPEIHVADVYEPLPLISLR